MIFQPTEKNSNNGGFMGFVRRNSLSDKDKPKAKSKTKPAPNPAIKPPARRGKDPEGNLVY